MPENMKLATKHIVTNDVLSSYHTFEGIEKAFSLISKRIKRKITYIAQ